MRAFSGWRFLLTVALPLVLASFAAIGLAYDLILRVQSSGNAVEHQRNLLVVTEALDATTKELARVVSENARWQDAFNNTENTVNSRWFDSTWGATISVGTTYDIAAVIELESGSVLAHNLRQDKGTLAANDIIGTDLSKISNALMSKGLLSGYANLKFGPATVAVAPITAGPQSKDGNGRALVMAKFLAEDYANLLKRQLLLPEVKVSTNGNDAGKGGIILNDLNGAPALVVSWTDRNVGELVTSSAWRKASAALGFLVLVMTGIGYVCWRLVQNLHAKERKASRDALHDSLTGLPNRVSLIEDLHAMYVGAKPPVALAYADLDGFKEVNDSYGHEWGDHLLRMVAAGIQQLGQPADKICRMGGDEFVVLFSGPNCENLAKTFSQQFIHFLGQPFDMDGRLASVGASIGIAYVPSAIDETELLRRADIAMYKAKETGRNRFCIYDESFDHERAENLAIAEELKSIISTGSIEVAFQPIINLRTNAISGVEALARWPKSSRRSVTPDRFIHVAETSGLIKDLGKQILDRACRAAQSWPTLRLAVNISVVQLNEYRFVENCLDTLAAYGIAPNRVEFEITETSLIRDMEKAKQVFKLLQLAGIKVALDDFGTGFSSIGYLRTFNFDRIKIDKSITAKLLASPAEMAVVQGTILVARGMSAEVTAEGVEREEEASVLKLAGCTELQGFHFHKPLEAREVSEILQKSKVSPPPMAVVA